MMKIRRLIVISFSIALLLATASCTLVPIDPDASPGAAGSSVLRARNVDEYLDEYWEDDILPEIMDRRVDLGTLLAAVQSGGWDHAGQSYGEIRGDIGASYTFIIYDTATVVETNTQSRNGFIVVQIDGYDEYEIRLSIGPALTGSAIRDSLRFVDFNQFVNQVDFARLATELNTRGNERAMENTDIFALDGKTIEFTGAFVAPEANNIISIMPIFLEEVN